MNESMTAENRSNSITGAIQKSYLVASSISGCPRLGCVLWVVFGVDAGSGRHGYRAGTGACPYGGIVVNTTPGFTGYRGLL